MKKLIVDIDETAISIGTDDGIEVVHWVCDEWEEDPTIVPAIANAIHLAFTNPKELIRINQKHIDSQR